MGFILRVRDDNGNVVDIPAIKGAKGDPGPALAVSNTAAVGQTVKITAVDDAGQPTEWETVDMVSGDGSENWRLIKTLNFSSEIAAIEFSVDDSGNEFALSEIMIRGSGPSIGSGYLYVKPRSSTDCNAIWPTAGKQFIWFLAAVDSALKTMMVVSDTGIIGPSDKQPTCGEKISNIIIGSSTGFTEEATLYVYGR